MWLPCLYKPTSDCQAHPALENDLGRGLMSPNKDDMISLILNSVHVDSASSSNLPYLDFTAFVRLLAAEPFDQLLPRTARQYVPLLIEHAGQESLHKRASSVPLQLGLSQDQDASSSPLSQSPTPRSAWANFDYPR